MTTEGWDLVVDRIVSRHDSIKPGLMAHSVYVVGQPRWQAPLVRPLIGDELPDESTVVELYRSDGRGILRLLFDPDRVTVSGCASDNPRVNDARGAFHRSLLETSGRHAGRVEGRLSGELMGDDDSDAQGTNESLVVKQPRVMTSHESCGHPNTKAARGVCRKARKSATGDARGDRAS